MHTNTCAKYSLMATGAEGLVPGAKLFQRCKSNGYSRGEIRSLEILYRYSVTGVKMIWEFFSHEILISSPRYITQQ